MGTDGYDGTIDDLAARVEVLERDVGIMRGILWKSGTAAQAIPSPAQPTRWTAPRTRPAPQESRGGPPWGTPRGQPLGGTPGLPGLPLRTPPDEARLAGTWFSRGGALAMLIGAGFGFKYGIDRGFITEPVRVLIGLLSGLAFVAWGSWARRKGWHAFSQAVTAGGIAICYLSVVIANPTYHLISAP